MDYIVKLLSEQSSAKYWWWLVFLVLAGMVVLLAKYAVNFLESIAERTTIASAFIGGVMLSVVTSLPEMVSAIYSGIENKPQYGISNAFGANMLTACILGIIDLVFIKKMMFKNIDRGNKVLVWLMVFINAVILIGILTPDGAWKEIPGINVSWLTLIPLISFFGYAIWASRSGGKKEDDIEKKMVERKDKIENKVPFANLPLWQVWLFFFLTSGALVFFAFNNSTAVDKFSPSDSTEWGEKAVYHIPLTTGAGLILSLATSLPEITSIILLMRKGLANIAIGGIIGSHLFNVAMIGLTDIIDQKGTTFNEIHDPSLHPDSYKAWVVGAFFISIILVMNATKWVISKKKWNIPLPSLFFNKKHLEGKHIVEINKTKYYYIFESVFLIAAYITAYCLTTFVFV